MTDNLRIPLCIAALLGGLGIRFFLSPFPGDIGDMSCNKKWGAYSAQYGVTHVYDPPEDELITRYPPLIQYYLAFVFKDIKPLREAKMRACPGPVSEVELNGFLKAPSILCDLAVALLVFFLLRPIFGAPMARTAGLLWWLNPGVAYVSSYWGQIESPHLLLALGGLALASFYALRPRLILAVASGFLFAAAILVKPTSSAGILPLAAWLLYQGGCSGALVAAVLGGVGGIALLSAPYLAEGTFLKMAGLYPRFISSQPFTAPCVANLWFLQKFYYNTHKILFLSLRLWGILFLLAGLAYGLWNLSVAWKNRGHSDRTAIALIIVTGAFLSLCAFILPTTVHERYLITSILFLAMASGFERRLAYLFWSYSAAFLVNLLISLFPGSLGVGSDPLWIAGAHMGAHNLLTFTAAFNTFNFFYFALHFPSLLRHVSQQEP